MNGENTSEYLKQAEAEADDQPKQLTAVAVSMFKDFSGNILATRMNVEINNSDEVLKIIIIALRDDSNSSYVKNHKKEQAFIQTMKPVYADLTQSWTPVVGWSNYDSWQTVVVSYSINLYKNPNNPDSNGKNWCMGETPVMVTPVSGYSSGGVNITQTSNSSGIVNNYGPGPLVNKTDVSMRFGIAPTASISVSFGSRMSMIIGSGTGQGYNNIRFSFWPVNFLGQSTPVSNQTKYDTAAQYIQSPTWYGQGFSYTVDMYTPYKGGFTWYATASHSGLSVSGT